MLRSPRRIADYDVFFDPIRAARQAKSGQQSDDPAKAAQVLLKIANSPDAPVHLLLGRDVEALVKSKLGRCRTKSLR